MSQLNASAPYVPFMGLGQSHALGSAGAASSQAKAAGSSAASPAPSSLAAKHPAVPEGNGAKPVRFSFAQQVKPSAGGRPLEARTAATFQVAPLTIESESESESEDEDDASPSPEVSPQVSPASTPHASVSRGTHPVSFAIRGPALSRQLPDAQDEADPAAAASPQFDRKSGTPGAEASREDEGADEDTPAAAAGPMGKAGAWGASEVTIEKDDRPEKAFMKGLESATNQRPIASELLKLKGMKEPLGPFMAGVIHGMGLGDEGLKNTSVNALVLQVQAMGANNFLSLAEMRECLHAIKWASTGFKGRFDLEAMIKTGSKEGRTEKQEWEKNLAMISWSGRFAPTSEGKADGIAGGPTSAPAAAEAETDPAAAAPAPPPASPSPGQPPPLAKPAGNLDASPPPPSAPDRKSSLLTEVPAHAARKADDTYARATITQALTEFDGRSEDDLRAFLDELSKKSGIERDQIDSIARELDDLANRRHEAITVCLDFKRKLESKSVELPKSFEIRWSSVAGTNGETELNSLRDLVMTSRPREPDSPGVEVRRADPVNVAFQEVWNEHVQDRQPSGPQGAPASAHPPGAASPNFSHLLKFAKDAKALGITNAFDPAPASSITSPISRADQR